MPDPDGQTQQQLSQRYRMTSLIVVALGISSAVCMILGKIVSGTLTGRRQEAESIGFSIYLLAAVASVLAILFRRFMLSGGVMRKAALSGASAVIGRLSMTSVIGAALGELIGILSLLGSVLTGDAAFSWRLGIVSLAVIAYCFPRRQEWIKFTAGALQSTQSSQVPDRSASK
jgi:hypothetical protein